MTKLGDLLERAMQVIVALRWGAHHTGEVHPEVEAEVRATLSQLYGAKCDVDQSPPVDQAGGDAPEAAAGRGDDI